MPARQEIELEEEFRALIEGLPPERLIRELCEVRSTPLVPEIRAYLASEEHSFWRQGEEAMHAYHFGMPFWGIPWAGGLALARYLLDHPHVVQGKRIWCFASGAGLEAIAACRSGATQVTVNDIDALACDAALLNATLNHVTFDSCTYDAIGRMDLGADVVLAGDFCYDEGLAARVFSWFELLHNQGVEILVGDPGRTFLERERLHSVWETRTEPGHEYDDPDVRRTAVFRYQSPTR